MTSPSTLPNLFVPGAAKSGTSSLHEYLGQHPDIGMSLAKEPHFFCRGRASQEQLQTYCRLFAGASNLKYRGESSTGYMVFPGVIQHIKELTTTPRFIFVLRNPVDRAISHFRWLQGQGLEHRPFAKALASDEEELPDFQNANPAGYKYYYQFGLYGKWIRRFYDAFSPASIHVITTESLLASPLETLNSCFRFLSIPELTTLKVIKNNPSRRIRFARIYGMLVSLPSSRAIALLRPAMPRAFMQRAQRVNQRLAQSLRVDSLVLKPVENADRAILAAKYSADVDELRLLTGLRFEDWANDFPLPTVALD